jgi:UDP-N-acetylmuramoylalanine--D-glutamate ligase
MSLPAWFPVSGKTYVVLGLARSGLAAVRWLQVQGARVIAIDDNPEKVQQAERLGATAPDLIPWDQVAALVQSPGVPLWFPAPHPVTLETRQRGIPVIGDGDLLRLAHPTACFIGITGTNGKSTTTALVGHILKTCSIDCQVGGNIGVPMLDLPSAETYVLELSSFQLDVSDGMDLDVAAWINLTPDHLDRHGSLKNYVAAKKKIFQTRDHQKLTAIIGIDDEASEAAWKEISATHKTIPVTASRPLDQGISLKDSWLREDTQTMMDCRSLPTLMGIHNWQNAAIAYGICRTLGIAPNQISAAMQTFPGLAHRQEWVRTLGKVCFINDSKGTNAAATSKALATYDRIYWIAGGQAKSDGIEQLLAFSPRIVHAFLIGEAQDRFAATLERKTPYTKSGTLAQAVQQAYQLARTDEGENPVVLLSPACASFDQFKDFEQRGDDFRQIVQNLES